MNDLVIKCGPTEFDHVALGTHDTQKGVAWLANLTGAEPVITEPEPGQWYWSAALPLNDGAMLEMLGPNPDHRGFHPLKALLARFQAPEPFFWHVATSDLGRFVAAVKQAGAPVERIEHLDSETPDGRRTYSRGVVGPGFRTVRPCVIQWISKVDRPGLRRPLCRATGFALRCPKPDRLNRVLEAIGLQLRATDGPQRLDLALDTPKGPIKIAGPGVVFEGLGAIAQFAQLRFASMLR